MVPSLKKMALRWNQSTQTNKNLHSDFFFSNIIWSIVQTTKTFKLGEEKQSYLHKIKEQRKKKAYMSLNKIETPAVKFYLLPRKFGMNPHNTGFQKKKSGRCKNTSGSLEQGNRWCGKEPCPGPYANRSAAAT